MADIKFMNLSENGNPATTDSVLIGNQQDGLKRTTLGTIGNMFSVHQALHFEEVSVLTSTKASEVTDPNMTLSMVYDIIAPAVPGYTFQCWIGSQSNGFTCGNYVINKTHNDAQIWVDAVIGSILTNSANSVTATALYVKNELA
ncbi:hypothetical protein [Lactobacillus gasseri]|uniref:hypothetical protein n=1 Tax=Lactobacillus gasseri TaxID=1596 RepID=UPI00344B9AB1